MVTVEGRSGREALAALVTTGGDDGAPRTGAHPKTEAVLLVPATVVRLERPLAHWNDSGYSRTRWSADPGIRSAADAVLHAIGILRWSRRERSTKGPVQHRPIHGTWTPVDRSNQVSPELSTGPVDRIVDDWGKPGPSHSDQTDHQLQPRTTTTLRRPPDTPQVAPNLSPVACG